MAHEALLAETISTTTMPSAPTPPPTPSSPSTVPPPPPQQPSPPLAASAFMTRRSSSPPSPLPPTPSHVFPTPSLLPRASGIPRGMPSERGLRTHSLLSRSSRSSFTRAHATTQPTKPQISTERTSTTQHGGLEAPAPLAASFLGAPHPGKPQSKHQPLFDTSLFESAQPVFMGTSPKKAAQRSATGVHQEDLHPNVPSSPRHPLIDADNKTEKAMPTISMHSAHSSVRQTTLCSPKSCVPSPTLSATPSPDSTVGIAADAASSLRASSRHAFSCDPPADRRRKMASSAATSSASASTTLNPSRSASSSRSVFRRGSAIDRTVAESDDDLVSPLVSAHDPSRLECNDSESDLAVLSPFATTTALLPFGHFDLVGTFDVLAPPLSITTGEALAPPPQPTKSSKQKRSLRRGRTRSSRVKRRVRRKIGDGAQRRTLRPNILIHPNYNPNSPSSEYLDGNLSSSSSTSSSSPNPTNTANTSTAHGYSSSDSSTPTLSASFSSPHTLGTPTVSTTSTITTSLGSDSCIYTHRHLAQPSRKKQRTGTHTDSHSYASANYGTSYDVPPFELGLQALTAFDNMDIDMEEREQDQEQEQELFLEDLPLDVMSHAFSWFYFEEVARILPVSKALRDVGQSVLARSRSFDDVGFSLDSKSALRTLSRAGACRLRKLVLLTRGTDQKVICNLFDSSATLRYLEIDSWMLTEPMIPLLARTKLEVLNVSGPSVPRVVRALRGLTRLRALFLNLSIFSEKDECRLARATCHVIAACPQLRTVGTSFSLLHCAKPSVRLPHITHVILPSLSRMLGTVMPNLEELCVWYPDGPGALSASKFLARLAELKVLGTLRLCFASVPRRAHLRDLFAHIEDQMPTLRALVCAVDAPSVPTLAEAVELARLSSGSGGSGFGGNRHPATPSSGTTGSWMSFLSNDGGSGSGAAAAAGNSGGGGASTSSSSSRSRRSRPLLLCPKLSVRVDKVDNIVSRLCQRSGIDV